MLLSETSVFSCRQKMTNFLMTSAHGIFDYVINKRKSKNQNCENLTKYSYRAYKEDQKSMLQHFSEKYSF